MEKSNVTPVSQYASWQEQPIELPTDEINVEKAEEVTKELEESGITFDETPFTYPQDGSRVELRGKTLVQQSMSSGITFDAVNTAVENLKDSDKKTAYAPCSHSLLSLPCVVNLAGLVFQPYSDNPDGPKELVQQSMSTLKELTNNPEVQKALESEGLTVDYGKAQAILNADELASASGLIRPLTPEEANATEGGTCACTDCVEATDNDVDTDTMLIVHDLSERLASLEERIAAFNRKASHKI